MTNNVSQKEIDDVMDECVDINGRGRSKFPGMSYEEGVEAALRWINGDGENPLDD